MRSVSMAVAAALLILVALPAMAGGDWPQFRGENRDGVSPETGLLDSWPENGPKEVWRVPLGEGYSGVSVVGDRLYTMYAGKEGEKEVEFIAAFDAASGKEIWKTVVGDKLDTEFGNGPRSTPTVDGDMLFSVGSYGHVIAVAAKDGKEKWKVALKDLVGADQPTWGYSGSIAIEGGIVFVEAGGKEGKSFVALKRDSGEMAWSIGDGRGQTGYNSPIAVSMGGERRFVYIAGGKLRAVNAEGKEVWAYEWPRGETHASPLFIAPDRIFASGVGEIGAKMIRVREDSEGLEVDDVWASRFMRNHFSSSVVHDGYIYGFDNATLKCISLEDGKMAWGKRGLGKGSMILADGHLVVLSDRGKLMLIEASPEGFNQKGGFQALSDKDVNWTAPSLSKGRLYLRNHQEMVSFNVKG